MIVNNDTQLVSVSNLSLNFVLFVTQHLIINFTANSYDL
jgi:hypothetical protein